MAKVELRAKGKVDLYTQDINVIMDALHTHMLYGKNSDAELQHVRSIRARLRNENDRIKFEHQIKLREVSKVG